MATAAIICEYNPFHNGHLRQFQLLRQRLGADTRIVCLLSGPFVQRGMPALFETAVRARAALVCGADLVLENPVNYVLRSAEGYAEGAVKLFECLGGVDVLCFGAEHADAGRLMDAARLLLHGDLTAALREQLDAGLPFASARQRAFEAAGGDGTLLEQPNDILAVEYCKALLRTNSTIEPLPLPRTGSHHTAVLQAQAPSATALRSAILEGRDWEAAVPEILHPLYRDARIYTLAAGERAMLALLRRMPRETFRMLPHGSEGLWSRFYRACQTQVDLTSILFATKSKRYALTRLQRLLMCACLGLDEALLCTPAPYLRVLAVSGNGRSLLREMRRRGGISLLHAGERAPESPFSELEQRAATLHELCAQDLPRAPADCAGRLIRGEG